MDADSIALPGVPGIYPNPLKAYREVLDRVLEGRQSSTHGDLNLRNVLLDEAGQGWLIDFARVDTRHNIFDFVKLETYVRLMVLGSAEKEAFSLGEYVEFEDALIEATLQKKERVPGNPYLWSGYQVIRTIAKSANKYMAEQTSFRHEYLPALFLYCLAVAKYYQEDRPQPTRLAFATACVLGAYTHGQDRQTAPAVRGEQIGPTARDVEQPSASIGQGQPGPAVPNLLPAPEVRPEELSTFFAHGHALLIGVGADLPMTVQDATALRDLLVDPDRAQLSAGTGGAVERNCSQPAAILDAFDRLAEHVNRSTDATAFIYFSGHGGLVDITRVYVQSTSWYRLAMIRVGKHARPSPVWSLPTRSKRSKRASSS